MDSFDLVPACVTQREVSGSRNQSSFLGIDGANDDLLPERLIHHKTSIGIADPIDPVLRRLTNKLNCISLRFHQEQLNRFPRPGRLADKILWIARRWRC